MWKTGESRIFGLNAYCSDEHYPEAQKQANFAAWCQERYNKKIFNVLKLWENGLSAHLNIPSDNLSLYYSNFVKLVLSDEKFFDATSIRKFFIGQPKCLSLFKCLICKELSKLRTDGCEIFVCFGHDAFNYIKPIADSLGIEVIRERHFSRYGKNNTKQLINNL